MTVTLYLVRHGETKLNAEERLRAWLDEPLNEKGIEESEKMKDVMANIDIDRIYASDLVRASRTAQIMAKPHGLQPILREWFRPLNYGDLEGEKISEIQPQLDRLNEIWKTNPDQEAPNGESFTEFQDRNLGGLHAVLKNAKEGEAILLVAHLRNCLLFHGVALNEGPLEGEAVQMMDGKRWTQASGSISRFSYDPEQEGDVLRYVGMLFTPDSDEQEEAPGSDKHGVLSETDTTIVPVVS